MATRIQPIGTTSLIQPIATGSLVQPLVSPQRGPSLIQPISTSPIYKLPDPNAGRGNIVWNILGDIWQGMVVEPVVGSAKVVGATLMTPLDLLGFEVPFTYEDLTSRDIRGATLMTALVLSGGVAGGIRTLPALQQLAARGFGGKIGAAAAAETLAGATFGVFEPLDDEEDSRLTNIIEEAAFGAGFGVAGSFVFNSAKRALQPARLNIMQRRHDLANMNIMALQQSIRFTKEAVGVTMANMEGAQAIIRRTSDKSVRLIYEAMGDEGVMRRFTPKFRTFGEALAEAKRLGYVVDTGSAGEVIPPLVQKALHEDFLREALDPTTGQIFISDSLQEQLDKLTGMGLDAELKKLNTALYDTAIEHQRTGAELASISDEMAADVLAMQNEQGVTVLTPQDRKALRNALPNPVSKRSPTDAALLANAIRYNVVSLPNIIDGKSTVEFFDQLLINEHLALLPDQFKTFMLNKEFRIGVRPDIVVHGGHNLYWRHLLTSATVALRHPEVAPLVRYIDMAEDTMTRNLKGITEQIDNMKLSLKPKDVDRIINKIAEESDRIQELATSIAKRIERDHPSGAEIIRFFENAGMSTENLMRLFISDDARFSTMVGTIGASVNSAFDLGYAGQRTLKDLIDRADAGTPIEELRQWLDEVRTKQTNISQITGRTYDHQTSEGLKHAVPSQERFMQRQLTDAEIKAAGLDKKLRRVGHAAHDEVWEGSDGVIRIRRKAVGLYQKETSLIHTAKNILKQELSIPSPATEVAPSKAFRLTITEGTLSDIANAETGWPIQFLDEYGQKQLVHVPPSDTPDIEKLGVGGKYLYTSQEYDSAWELVDDIELDAVQELESLFVDAMFGGTFSLGIPHINLDSTITNSLETLDDDVAQKLVDAGLLRIHPTGVHELTTEGNEVISKTMRDTIDYFAMRGHGKRLEGSYTSDVVTDPYRITASDITGDPVISGMQKFFFDITPKRHSPVIVYDKDHLPKRMGLFDQKDLPNMTPTYDSLSQLFHNISQTPGPWTPNRSLPSRFDGVDIPPPLSDLDIQTIKGTLGVIDMVGSIFRNADDPLHAEIKHLANLFGRSGEISHAHRIGIEPGIRPFMSDIPDEIFVTRGDEFMDEAYWTLKELTKNDPTLIQGLEDPQTWAAAGQGTTVGGEARDAIRIMRQNGIEYTPVASNADRQLLSEILALRIRNREASKLSAKGMTAAQYRDAREELIFSRKYVDEMRTLAPIIIGTLESHYDDMGLEVLRNIKGADIVRGRQTVRALNKRVWTEVFGLSEDQPLLLWRGAGTGGLRSGAVRPQSWSTNPRVAIGFADDTAMHNLADNMAIATVRLDEVAAFSNMFRTTAQAYIPENEVLVQTRIFGEEARDRLIGIFDKDGLTKEFKEAIGLTADAVVDKDAMILRTLRAMGMDVDRLKAQDGQSLWGSMIYPTFEEARDIVMREMRGADERRTAKFVMDMLESYRQRLIKAGYMKEGMPGYFPIINSDQWGLRVVRRNPKTGKAEAEDAFRGFHGSIKEAMDFAQKIADEEAGVLSVNVTLRSLSLSGAHGEVYMDPSQFGALINALADVGQFNSSKELREFAKKYATITPTGKPTRPFLGAALPRILGHRDFQRKSGWEALNAYTYSAERALAFQKLPVMAEQTLAGISMGANKSNLRAWVEQLVDDVLGRPRKVEQAFQAVLESMGLDPKPRALARYSAALRKWQAFGKLGGFWSGIVNLTQINMNTYPVLGGKWTSVGIKEVLGGPDNFLKLQKEMFEANVDEVFLFMPFSAEGSMIVPGGIKDALRKKEHLEAVYRMFMFTFNGAEKVNRMVTAVGAYRKYMAENAGRGIPAHLLKQRAGAYANRIVRRTQFNYRHGNMPEVLRGPLGATLGQFKSFVINELEFIGSLNKTEMTKFVAALTAAGGLSLLFNMPGGDMVDAASTIFSDESLQERLKLGAGQDPEGEGVAAEFRHLAAKYAAFGLPGVLFDVDMSDYVGVGNLREVTQGILGPSVNDMKELLTFFKDGAIDYASIGRLRNETVAAAWRGLAPSAMRRASMGYSVMRTGEVRDQVKGKLMYRPHDMYRNMFESPAATAFKLALGAPPVRLQQEYAASRVASRVRERFIQQHGDYAKRAAKARIDKNFELSFAIMQEARENGILLKNQAIVYQMKEMQEPAALRRIQRTPTQRRARIAEAVEAMGVPPQDELQFQRLKRSDPNNWPGLMWTQ